MLHPIKDPRADALYDLLRQALEPVIEKMFPDRPFELSHIGVGRQDFLTEEIKIVLHINPLGRIKIVDEDRLEPQQSLLEK